MDPVQEALIVHNHPATPECAGDLGPSPQDLLVLSRRAAAGCILRTPGALWFIGFPYPAESLLSPEGVTPEEREQFLRLAAAEGKQLIASGDWRLLKHLAAACLRLLGASWVRIPKNRLLQPLNDGKEVAGHVLMSGSIQTSNNT